MTYLKPCPFCGQPINKENYRTYSCDSCGYALVMDVFEINGEEFERDHDAIWNRRVKE